MKKHKLIALTLSEFSAVRKPAMEGASIDITKSADLVIMAKDANVVPPPGPGPSDVHTNCAGCKKPMQKSSIYCSACGAPATKSADLVPTPENKNMMTDQEKAEKAALETKLAKAEKLADLNDVQKLHYKRLAADDQEKFLKMSAAERVEDCKPVHTAKDGTVFTKADDPRLIEMSKSADKRDLELTERLEKADATILLKRADDELPYLPGTSEERAELLKAVDGIKDEKKREAASKALKAHNEKLGKSFGRQGVGTTVTQQKGGDPEKQLEEKVQKHFDESKDDEMTIEKAWEEVLESKEGKALYKASEDAKRAAGAN